MSADTIRILITGGTLDKEYDQIKGQLNFSDTHLPQMLEQVKCTVPVELETLLLEDSLDMTDADRAVILARCRELKDEHIIITHGTDTMVETARVLGPEIRDKTIVLVGAMVPFSFGHSDALFNLGCAVTAVQAMAGGVYITMNGRIFAWDNVRKNKDEGLFEETGEES